MRDQSNLQRRQQIYRHGSRSSLSNLKASQINLHKMFTKSKDLQAKTANVDLTAKGKTSNQKTRNSKMIVRTADSQRGLQQSIVTDLSHRGQQKILFISTDTQDKIILDDPNLNSASPANHILHSITSNPNSTKGKQTLGGGGANTGSVTDLRKKSQEKRGSHANAIERQSSLVESGAGSVLKTTGLLSHRRQLTSTI